MRKLLETIKRWPKKVVIAAILVVVAAGGIYAIGTTALKDFPRQGSVYDWIRASTVYDQAEKLRKAYKSDEAIAKYDEAVRIYPLDSRFLLGKGIAYIDKNDYKEAESALQASVRVNPKATQCWLRLSQLGLITNNGQLAHDAGAKALGLQDRDPVVLAQMGLVWFEEGNWHAAEKIFNQSTNLGSESPEFWLQAGKYHWRTKQNQRAVADFRQAIAMDPKNAEGYEWLGLIESKGPKPKEAEKDLTKAVELNPNSPVYWRNLGMYYTNMKQFDKALEPYRQAAKLNPHDVKTWRDIAQLALHEGKLEEAEKAIKMALDINPGDGPTCGLLVATLRKEKKYDQAQSVMRNYIMGGHKYSASLWVYLATLYEEGGKPEQAAEAYNQALAAEPTESLKEYIVKRLSGEPTNLPPEASGGDQLGGTASQGKQSEKNESGKAELQPDAKPQDKNSVKSQ